MHNMIIEDDCGKDVEQINHYDLMGAPVQVQRTQHRIARFMALIRLKRIYNFLCSMLVYTPFALCFVTLRGVFMHFPELTY
jgi:hypothetical protein